MMVIIILLWTDKFCVCYDGMLSFCYGPTSSVCAMMVCCHSAMDRLVPCVLWWYVVIPLWTD